MNKEAREQMKTLQKSMETLEEYLDQLKGYNQKLHICGSRNRFSKTDHDAAFMRMKEDAMENGQLKPAFNLQHGVGGEYVTWRMVGPQPTDTATLLPYLTEAEEYLKFKYRKAVADAGYESEETYRFLEKNGQLAFILYENGVATLKMLLLHFQFSAWNISWNNIDNYYG